MDECAHDFRDDHVLVGGGFCQICGCQYRLVLDHPIQVVDRIVDWVREQVIGKHGEPAEVEGSAQVEAGCDFYPEVVWDV